MASPYTAARWVSADDPRELDRFVEGNAQRVARDAADALAVLTGSTYEMKVIQEMWPNIRFHAQREHAGLILEGLTELPA